MRQLTGTYEGLRIILLQIQAAADNTGLAVQEEVLPVLNEMLSRAGQMGLRLDGSMKDPVTGAIIPGVDVATEDGTPVRDYIDAEDLALAHELA